MTNTRRRIKCGRRKSHYAKADALEATDNQMVMAAAAGALPEAGQQSGIDPPSVATMAAEHKRRYKKHARDKHVDDRHGYGIPGYGKHGYGQPDYGAPGFGGPSNDEPKHGKRDYDGPHHKVHDGTREPAEHHGRSFRYVVSNYLASSGSYLLGDQSHISRAYTPQPLWRRWHACIVRVTQKKHNH